MLEGKSTQGCTGYQMTTINEGHSVNPDGKSIMMIEDAGGGQQHHLLSNNSSLPRKGSKGSGRHVKIANDDDDNKTSGANKALLGHHNHHPPNDNVTETKFIGSSNHEPDKRKDKDESKLSPTMSGPLLGVAATTTMNSRRASEVSTCFPPDTPPPNLDYNNGRAGSIPDEGHPHHRRSKGFIRFPSIRRSSTDGKNGPKCGKNSRRTDRTSKMLIAVLVLFLVTEFPQGIMALLTGIYGQHFLQHCYNSWAEVWDTLALINGAINFILYCFMSKQFRLQFRLIFRLNRYCKRPKWINMTCNQATISTTV